MKSAKSILTLIFLVFLTQFARAQSEDDILGTWYNTEKSAKIEIVKEDGEFIGKIISVTREENGEGPFYDDNNSDPDLRSRPLKGLHILEGLRYKKGEWDNGEIYDPESGKTYSCELKLQTPDILEVKGYIGFSFVGKTVEWTRIKD